MSDNHPDIDFQQLDLLRQTHLGRLLLKTYRAFSSGAIDKLKTRGYSGISLAQMTMLMNIDAQGIQLTKLGEKIGVSRQAIANLAKSLEQKNYLTRSSDPSDKRAIIVSLSESGWILIKDIVEVKGEIEKEYCDIIGAEQMALLRKSLSGLLNVLEY